MLHLETAHVCAPHTARRSTKPGWLSPRAVSADGSAVDARPPAPRANRTRSAIAGAADVAHVELGARSANYRSPTSSGRPTCCCRIRCGSAGFGLGRSTGRPVLRCGRSWARRSPARSSSAGWPRSRALALSSDGAVVRIPQRSARNAIAPGGWGNGCLSKADAVKLAASIFVADGAILVAARRRVQAHRVEAVRALLHQRRRRRRHALARACRVRRCRPRAAGRHAFPPIVRARHDPARTASPCALPARRSPAPFRPRRSRCSLPVIRRLDNIEAALPDILALAGELASADRGDSVAPSILQPAVVSCAAWTIKQDRVAFP